MMSNEAVQIARSFPEQEIWSLLHWVVALLLTAHLQKQAARANAFAADVDATLDEHIERRRKRQ